MGLARFVLDADARRSTLDGGGFATGFDLHAVQRGDAKQLLGQCPHATLWDAPLSGAIANHVVEETAVGLEVISLHEGSDQGIGQNHAPHQVIAEPVADGFANRALHQVLP